MGILIRLGISAAALWITTLVLPGITLDTNSNATKVFTLVVVAVIFGMVNAVIKPLVKVVGCAFYVFTLGLISIVVNGLLFMLVSWIAGYLGLPFNVDQFWPTAVIGALLVGVISWVLSLVVPDKD